MAAGHQLKKLAQSRGIKHQHVSRWIDYMPRHWSIYTLVFSTGSLLVFCFLFYDVRSSPTSLLRNASRELGALRAQVGDSYLFSLSPPAETATGDSDSEGVEGATKHLDSDSEAVEGMRKHMESELKKEKARRDRRGKKTKQQVDTEEVIESESAALDIPGDEKDDSAKTVKSLDGTDFDATGVTEESRLKGKIESNVESTTEGKNEIKEESTTEGKNEIKEESISEGKIESNEESRTKGKEESKEDSSSRLNGKNERIDEVAGAVELLDFPTEGDDLSQTGAKDVDVTEPEDNEKESTVKETKEADIDAALAADAETFKLDVPTEDKIEETVALDDKSMEDMINVAAAGAEAEENVSAAKSSDSDERCDYSKGQWVYDENYPLYKPNTCPFVDGGFRCVENGRPSDEFQKWRWQPTGCDLPRFDAKDMLERLRGGRMAFVGDSIGRNHWESMLCMLAEAVPNKTRIYEINGAPITKHTGYLSFRFEDYDCTVEYYRSPHLVPQGRAPPNSDPRVRSTLKLDQIDWSSGKWRDADIVLFNSGHWWSFEKTVRGGNYFQEGKKVHLNMTVGEAFTRAMKTVARFVEKNMDATKSQVFFRSYAPVHFKGGTWDHGGTCNDDTKPLQKFPFVYQDKTGNSMILKVMEASKTNPVSFLNITYMSDLRPDGHSSIWQNVPNSPKNRQDCSHWCLPGVPDTWNEILFANLLRNGKGKWGSQAESQL